MGLVAWFAAVTLATAGPAEVLPSEPALAAGAESRPGVPAWTADLVNVAFGAGPDGASRGPDGWLREHWIAIDAFDRPGRASSHRFLEHRGIRQEFQGFQEFQETLHFHETGALALFVRNGLARDWRGDLVRSPGHTQKDERWARRRAFDAYITDPTAPRWQAVLEYDWLTSPLFGDAISQDNVGVVMHRIGDGQAGRFGPIAERTFREHLSATGQLSDFLHTGSSLEKYIGRNLAELFLRVPPLQRPADRSAVRALAEDPVLAAYLRYHARANLAALARLYAATKRVAHRQGRDFSVHGNLGGGFFGLVPYAVLAGDLLDLVWTEASGLSQYDLFRNRWSNAWGPFRLQLADAVGGGTKPALVRTFVRKGGEELFAHELAEASAGGGVLLAEFSRHAGDRAMTRALARFVGFRDQHRAIYAPAARQRHAKVAVLYSVSTLLFSQVVMSASVPPFNDLGGVARALEVGHVPYEIVILGDDGLRPDGVDVGRLARFDVVVAPGIENLSERHAAVLEAYLKGGGTLMVVGPLGARDERNAKRPRELFERMRLSGTAVSPFASERFPSSRTPVSDETRKRTRRFAAAVRGAVDAPIVDGELAPTTWVKTWTHSEGFFTAHFVNYDFDHESGEVRTAPAARVRLRPPGTHLSGSAVWLVPGEAPKHLDVQRDSSGLWSIRLPPLHIYGVLVLGRAGAEEAASLRRRGDQLLERVGRIAVHRANDGGEVSTVAAWRENAARYSRAAERLLRKVSSATEREFRERAEQRADWTGSRLSLDFGGRKATPGWSLLRANDFYDPDRGYGWLEPRDRSAPSPEERYYVPAHKRAEQSNGIREAWLPFWPHTPRLSPPLHALLYSGREQRLRIDVPDGVYRAEIVYTNPGTSLRNYLVSGLTRVGDVVAALDTPLAAGDQVSRRVWARAENGHVEFRFGGATGWAISALHLYAAETPETDDLVPGALRHWRVSPRYANPDWFPIERVRGAPEADLAAIGRPEWIGLSASPAGIPVVDLGTGSTARTGDLVYAHTTYRAKRPGIARLSLASTSPAIAFWNGEPVARIENVKGIERDEATARVRLREGENVLVLKLQRFWERRWLFYASVLTEAAVEDAR